MIATALLLALQGPAPPPVPAPPAPPVDRDYQVDCQAFGADGSGYRFHGRFEHVNSSRSLATLSSESEAFPFPGPGTSVPSVGPGEFIVQLTRGARHYSYFFDLPAGSVFANGTVRVSSGPGRGGSSWVATGICAVSKTRADSR